MSAFIKTAFTAAVLAGAAAASPALANTCLQGICVSGTDNGAYVYVGITHHLRGVTHFNVLRNGQQQETSGFYSFPAKRGFTQYYSVQACARGGFLGSSGCTAWVRFHHVSR